MFNGASAFNQPLASFDTSSVTTMSWMFHNASAFAQDITGWSTPALTYSSFPMFFYAAAWLAKFECVDGSTSTNGPPSSWRVKVPVFTTVATTGNAASGSTKYDGAAAVGSNVYFAPYHQNNVGVLDTTP